VTVLVKRRLLILALAVLFLSFGLFAPFEQTISAYCLVEPAHQWSLRHFGSGMIAAEWDVNLTGRESESLYFQIDQPDISKISVSPSIALGSHVALNERVATIESVLGMNQLTIGEATVEREMQRRVAMASGGRAEDIEVEQRRVERDRVELESFELEYDRLKSLYESNLLSLAKFERAAAKLSELQNEYELSLARLRATVGGAHPEELKMQDAEIKRLAAEVDGLRERFGSGLDILSPIDGVVAPKSDSRSVLVIQNMDTLALRIVFPESFAGYFETGVTVDVFFPGTPVREVQVQMDQFGFYGGDTSATYGLGLVDNRPLNLLPGMHGTAELPLGRITLLERIRNFVNTDQ
jgi:hypothetical protein